MKSLPVAEQVIVALPIPTILAMDLVPELATLTLLDATCVISIRALACAHPEIGFIDDQAVAPGCAPLFPSAAACTASCIISHLEAVRFGINSYRCSIDRNLPGVAAAPDQNNIF